VLVSQEKAFDRNGVSTRFDD